MERFYGTTIREFLAALPIQTLNTNAGLSALNERLNRIPEASYDEFTSFLNSVHNSNGANLNPVLIIDEFDNLLEEGASEKFTYPDFFNGLRSIIGFRGILAMMVTTQIPLVDYFRDSNRPKQLTSTFPTYFPPVILDTLDEHDAMDLLMQPSRHQLTLQQARTAWRWTEGHPCLLQAAGESCFRANEKNKSAGWAFKTYQVIHNNVCYTKREKQFSFFSVSAVKALIAQTAGFLFLRIPVFLGRTIQRFGGKFDQVASWIIGGIIILMIMLLLFGKMQLQELTLWVRKIVGLGD
ncbi:MAG: hypothetical protein IPM66_03060 [Acidobacteriota bacterium]|nr:MAG: hypothetical protein IPM66_03060 [Acidobacteriota bacterium]